MLQHPEAVPVIQPVPEGEAPVVARFRAVCAPCSWEGTERASNLTALTDYDRHVELAAHFYAVMNASAAEDEDTLHCDFCDVVENAGDLTPDWNGDTGNHRSCERNQS